MINRVSDEVFENDGFRRIAESLKQCQKKLFSVVKSEDEARKIKAELTTNGYQSSYEQKGNYFNIYYSPIVPKVKVDDCVMNSFQQITNNSYQIKGKSAFAGVYDYAYDDGSIWTLQDINGEKYLVKEIKGDDENEVVRHKKATASLDTTSLDKKIIASLKKNNAKSTPFTVNEIKNIIYQDMTHNDALIDGAVKKYISEV